MWFGTQNGLNRYDAYKFETWKHIPGDTTGIPDNLIRDITEDKYGNIWIGTNNGLCVYNYHTNLIRQISQTETPKKQPIPSDIRQLALQDSILWIADVNGLFIIELAHSYKLTYLDLFDGSIYNTVSIAVSNDNNAVWFSTFHKGVFKFTPTKGNLEKIGIDELKNDFSDVLFFKNPKTLLIGTNKHGMLEYSVTSGKVKQHLFQQTENGVPTKIYAIERDLSNQFWVSQGHNLYLCDSMLNKIREVNDNKPLSKSNISGLILDIFCDENTINWFATDVSGVFLYKEDAFPLRECLVETGNEEDNKSYVRSATVDSAGNKWIGTFGNGLLRYNSENKLLKRYLVENSGLPGNIVYDVEVINSHEYWIATSNGVVVFDPVKEEWTKTYTVKNNLWHNKTNLLEYANNSIWMATREGLNRYDMETGNIVKIDLQDGLVHYKIIDIQKDRFGHIWLATSKGVSRYNSNTGKFTNFKAAKKEENGLSSDNAYSICPDTGTVVWIGTANGLNKYDYKTNSFTWYFEKDRLYDNVVKKIILDNQGRLCILTPSGLEIMNRDLERLRFFNKEDGLTPNLNVLTLTNEGSLLLGGKNSGFYEFKTDNLSINQTPPPVYITHVYSLTDQKAKNSMERSFEFSYPNRNIKIEFTALDYFSPVKNRYAYKLEGVHDQWVVTSSDQRNLVLYNLSPGQYTFKVIASNNSNVWNVEGDQVDIKILPPWWRTWRMFIFYMLLFLSMILVILLLRTKRNQLLDKIKQAKVNQEADEMKLRYFTDVSHEFRTPLTLISVPVEATLENNKLEREDRERLLLANNNIRKMHNLVDELLDYRKLTQGKIEVKAKPVNVVGYLHSIYNTFLGICKSKGIQLDFENNQENVYGTLDTKVLDKIMYNLVSNALKNTPAKGKIMLGVDSIEGRVRISVSNTGKGIENKYLDRVFDRFFQLTVEGRNSTRSSGIGLSIVKDYAGSMDGDVVVESEIDGPTTFILSFPILPYDDNFAQLEKTTSNLSIQDIELENKFTDRNIQVKNNIQINAIGEQEKVMLVVEDNDEMRELIREMFTSGFKVVLAADGAQGMQKAKETIPDIVISDIMMPEMNGIELCEKLKTDKDTCHVPVILLTAKAMIEDRLVGYETGADEYVTKPFHQKLLKARVINLIEGRQRIKTYFSDSDYYKIGDSPDISSLDKRFIDEAENIMLQNYSNDQFGVADFAKLLHISRSSILRKFITFMGISPSDYMRSYRLHKAAEMLRSSATISVSEVAFQTGFKHASNFTRSFQSFFNMSPKEYQNQ